MADINHVILVGRLTRDAELRYTGGGMAVTKMGLAVNRRKKNGDEWVEEAHFFDIVAWGKLGESLTPYLVKGKQIGVEGELRQNRWEQDGQKRSKVEIHATNLQLLGSRGDTQPNQGGGYQQQSSPQQGGAPNSQPFENYNNKPAQNGPVFEDDIPF